MKQARTKSNNFDLLRLVAALQVAVVHANSHLGAPFSASLEAVLQWFPGVPIFFLVSGFLIYQSFEFTNDLGTFFRNRMLRLYPGLIACVVVSLAAVAATGYFGTVEVPRNQFVLWCLGQTSIVQFYNPAFMRGFGVGVLNGSLWTISVEMQFYLLMPLIFYAVKRSKNVDRSFLWLVSSLLTVSLACRFLSRGAEDQLAVKLLYVSFVPWFYMFVLGAYLSQKPSLVRLIQRVHPAAWLAVYLAASYAASRAGLPFGNEINPLIYLILVGMVFSIAFNNVDAARRVLHGNDISYGVYIYHMPVVNMLVQKGYRSSPPAVALAIGATVTIAAISWFVLEKPFLRLKRRSLRPIATAGLAVGA